MRLRHIKGCEEYIKNSIDCISGENILDYVGKWYSLFDENRPLHIEIGMGKGKFIRESAMKYKDINFIGIEKYESVLMKAIQRKNLIEKHERISNLKFLSVDAIKLNEVFKKGEVDKIYLNFSDPWPKARHANRRLTSEVFLKVYDDILRHGGSIEFKTDNINLFEYSLETIKDYGFNIVYESFDFHNDELSKDNIMTEYEEKFSSRGQKICKLIARRKDE